MDYSSRFNVLQQQIADAKSSVQAATSESAAQLRRRIDQAQADGDQAAQSPRSGQNATGSRNKWDQMRSDASDKMKDIKERIHRRNQQIDADMAATDADFAEADANDAIDYAAWTVDNARLAVLDALEARAYADTQARAAS